MKRKQSSKQIERLALIAVGLQLLLVMPGCGRSALERKPWHKGEVETSPGVFIRVEERSISSDDGTRPVSFRELHVFGDPQKGRKFSETYELSISWQGTNVHWKGNSGPLNLRSFEGRLFLITFDRVSKGADECLFRYYAQEGNELKEVPPLQFPKTIAGQNLDFLHRYFGGMNGRRDKVQIARDMDPEDGYFRQSLTAYIWNHLTTGEQYEQSRIKSQVSQSLLEEYIRTNKPVKLTAIIREQGSGGSNKQALEAGK